MPWCERCDAYRSPNALTLDGTCAQCGSEVDIEPTTELGRSSAKAKTTTGKIPWHFWLILILVSGYLGWRLIQLIAWLIGRVA